MLTPSWLILLSVIPSISSVRLCSSTGNMIAINSSRSSPKTAEGATFIFEAVCRRRETSMTGFSCSAADWTAYLFPPLRQSSQAKGILIESRFCAIRSLRNRSLDRLGRLLSGGSALGRRWHRRFIIILLIGMPIIVVPWLSSVACLHHEGVGSRWSGTGARILAPSTCA